MRTAASEAVSVEQYLKTAYSPDCDYVDGTIEERNVGEFDHAEVQGAMLAWFRKHDKEWSIHAVPDLRIQVSPTRFRGVDVCLLDRRRPVEQIPKHPPVAVIEVLSAEDRVSRYRERLADYRRMGIANVWVVDPENRTGYNCSTADWIETTRFEIKGSPVAVDLAAIFAELESNA